MFVFGGNNSGIRDDYKINNSLRFRSSASAYLNRTPASAGSTTTWTISFWIKLSDLASSVDIFSAGGAGTETELRYGYNTLGSFSFSVNGTTTFIATTALRRDPSSWYHIVVVANTTSATSTERFKLYVNNELQTFTTATQPAQNTSMGWNNNVLHYIGRRVGATSYFDGYIAEFHSIDGQALTPSSFGYTHPKTGVWRPKPYTGSYGTNGFYLKFSDIATTSGSNAGLGKDFSGNSNYWTTNNISVTSGSTYDAMTDSPTLGGSASNYAVLNPLDKKTYGAFIPNAGSGAVQTLSNANLTATSADGSAFSTWWFSTQDTVGKWYFEITGFNNGDGIGLDGFSTIGGTSGYNYLYRGSGLKYTNGSSSAYGASYTTTDIVGVALDSSTGSITFYKNNVSQGVAWSGIAGFYRIWLYNNTSATQQINFGQRPFTYTPPTGYKALNTFNLPTVTIPKGNKVMDATLWTGDGSAQTITNAGAFKPDLVWWKNRNSTRNHLVFDSIRGVGNYIQTNSTNAEATDAQMLTSFNSNGFTHGTSANGATNAETYVGWQWQAGQGTTSSNTSGSITSTVSVNASAGFSVVTYTNASSGTATVGHGLGVAPAMIITKQRGSAGNWRVYHKSLSAGYYLLLNSTAAQSNTLDIFTTTLPTSTVFSLGTTVAGEGTAVAYCWAEIAGFSKFGSYTGNASTDGTFVYLGFRPKFIMVKSSSGVGNWFMMDSMRDTSNVATRRLFANLSNAEDTSGLVDFTSNGFKLRMSTALNDSATYIYMAFAENPFKYSLAR